MGKSLFVFLRAEFAFCHGNGYKKRSLKDKGASADVRL